MPNSFEFIIDGKKEKTKNMTCKTKVNYKCMKEINSENAIGKCKN